jgi:glutathione S-transferase
MAQIVFYDIAFRPPVTESTCAPNPWKARYALNFKGVPYATTWVEMPEISKVRQAVGAPAGRKFADGSDFYTLPMLTDSSNNAIVGDSFDIAVHLQQTYPDSGAGDLFPKQALDFVYATDQPTLIPLSVRDAEADENLRAYAQFNTNVDAAVSAHVGLLAHTLPFDPATAEATHAEFVRRAGVSSWDDFAIRGEARAKMLQSLNATLAPLAEMLAKDPAGPFLLGAQASYADMIIGGWLRMMSVAMPAGEWEEVKRWHGGVFGKLHEGLGAYAQVP